MMQRLWAGWRREYVTGLTEPAQRSEGKTLFEQVLACDDDLAAGVIYRGELASVILNAYPYGSGHVMAIPNRGVGRLAELTKEERSELWDTVDKAVLIVETEYEPHGINVGLNQGRAAGAGIPEHLHVHILPRWSSDTNFMTSIAETRVLSEDLLTSCKRLRKAWTAAN